jgi:hypothetical protein
MKLVHRLMALPVLLGLTTLAGIQSKAIASDSPGHRIGSDKLVVDVALDGRTWRSGDGSNPFYPTLTGQFGRGNTFIVTGHIYKANTLASGGNFNQPGNPAGPDLPEPIGTWVCRGTFNLDFGDIANGGAPHVTSTQFFYFDDGTTIVTDGAEGGAITLRAVIGGTGRYRNAKGESIETPLGVNDTNLFNVRFRFKLH